MSCQPAWQDVASDSCVGFFGRDGLFLLVEAWLDSSWGLWYFQITDLFEENTCYASGNALTRAGMEKIVRDQIALLVHAGFQNKVEQPSEPKIEASLMLG